VARRVDLRVGADLFAIVRAHVEDFTCGEEAGFLVCSLSRLADRDVLLAREWLPVPRAAIERNARGSVLSWSEAFNSHALERALELDGTPVLVHSHGHPNPTFSSDDRRKECPLFGAFSRLLATLPTGTIVLGDHDAIGSFWVNGANTMELGKIEIAGQPLEVWWPPDALPAPRPPRQRLARQSVAIGPASDAKLADASVAVIGISGGGTHVVQQLAHQGVGTIIAVDDQFVDETNLGRAVGAVEADIDSTAKTDLAERVATGIDHTINVVKVPQRFPSLEAIDALKEADVIVTCVDRFDARENINAFARRYLIPFVDIGLAIRSSGERLATADGQVAVALPGHPCLRCWLITDAVLAHEREQRPPGYDQNPDASGDPQVVSLNGVLASEACNCVLDLITGYSGDRRTGKFWQYEGRSGILQPHDLPSHSPTCPACAQEGHGDPRA
jgi:molybdopterin-synthase adenylyltransferase